MRIISPTIPIIALLAACDAATSGGGATTTSAADTTAGDTAVAGADDTSAATAAPDTATPTDPTPAGLARLTGFGAGTLNAVAAAGARAWVGTPHGLYRADGPDYALEFVAPYAEHVGDLAVLDVVTLDDGAVVTLGAGFRISRSDDGGATWRDLSPKLELEAGALTSLATDGRRLLLVPGGGAAYLWESAQDGWRELPNLSRDATSTFPNAPEVAPLVITEAGFDGDTLVANSEGYPMQGAYVLAPEPPTTTAGATSEGATATAWEAEWHLVDGLDQWGYRAFSFDGQAAVTSNNRGVFVRDANGWRSTETRPNAPGPANAALVVGDVVLSASAGELMRSADRGVTWEVGSLVKTFGRRHALAQGGARTFWVTDAFRSSGDVGATWVTHEAEIDVPMRLAVGDGAVVTVQRPNGAAYQVDATGTAAEALGIGVTATELVVVGGEIWVNGYQKIQRRALDAEAFEDVPMPAGLFEYDDLRRLMTDGEHVFSSRTRVWESWVPATSCGVERWDEARGAFVRADAGLPAATGPNLASCPAAIRGFAGAGGVLLATAEAGGTYRSFDAGASWALIEGVGDVRTAAACGGALLVMLTDGAFVVSRDGGETFAAVAPPDLSRATDLAQLGRRCVVGLGRSDGGATLWASEDGSDFSILVEGFTEPVARLAADAGGTLAVATQSRGVFRAHVE
ncbi:MAG: hypothetical protein H6745_30630 [Deltaproteobacteria bacterium]|nr:hypothetical protein [Deltaproteobacteria bacterium]